MDDNYQYLIDLKKYRKIEEIDSQSHLNKVYLIENKETREKYVAKSSRTDLDSDSLKSFVRELKILIYIQIPVVIKLEGFSYQDMDNHNKITIITKYLENGTLTNFLNSPNLNDTNRQIILCGISFGMMLLHDHFIIQRDLKSDNVLLDENYYPIITDFGTSKVFDPINPTNNTLYRVGTPKYTAPEIFMGIKYTIKVDVYSFGILMYEVVTGQRAYSDLTEYEKNGFIFNVITQNMRPKTNNVNNKGLKNMMKKCWSGQPEERPSFVEIFKKLSLLSKEEIEEYENKFPFLKNDKSNLLKDDFNYSFDNVDKETLHSYIKMLFDNLNPQKVAEINAKFYETRDIYINIISLFKKNKFTEDDMKGPNEEFFKNKLSIFLPIDLEPIINDFKVGSFKMLIECFIFKEYNNILSEILQKDNIFANEGSLKMVAYYTFCSYISISLQLMEQQKIDFSLLLGVLNKIINIESKYRDIAFSCFTNILYIAIEKDAIVNFDGMMKELSVFYTKISHEEFVKTKSNRILYLVLKKFVKENEKLSNESISVINLIYNIIENNPSLMDKETVYIIFYLTKSFIYQFEENCFNLYLKMAKFTEEKDLYIFGGLAKECIIKLSFEKAINVFLSIIKTLSETVAFKKSMVNQFESVMQTFYDIAMDINIELLNTKQIDDIFISVINFWNSIYRIKNTIDNSLIESLINHFFNKIENIKIIEKLLQIILNNNVSQKLRIDGAFAIRLLVNHFLMTNQIKNILEYISFLCSISEYNSIKCHECGLDLLIIDILFKWRKNIIKLKPRQPNEKFDYTGFEVNENTTFVEQTNEGLVISEYIIDLFLHLFSQIASKASSTQTIHRFFSLLCPFHYNDSSCLSLIHKKIIDSFQMILYKSRFAPNAYLELPSKPISILNIPSDAFKDGFSIVFWIYKSSLNADHQLSIDIFKFKEKKQIILLPLGKNLHSLHLQISEKNMILNMKIGTLFVEYKILDKIPLDNWSMITLTLSPILEQPNHSKISFYVNQEKVDSKELEVSFSPSYSVDCLINNSDANIDFEPLLLGNFILSKPLLDEEISILASNGQKSPSLFKDKIYFAFMPEHLNGELSYKTINHVNDAYATFPHEKRQKILSFTDMLLENDNINIIIPIFQQSDLTLIDGSSCEFMNVESIQILDNLFHLGNDFQCLFCQSNCFYAISYCLQNINANNITNALYILYFYLLDSISEENSDLRFQLIDSILMNYNLWNRIDFINQNGIFKHWSTLLYGKCSNIINSARSFQWFLFIIQNCHYSEIRSSLFSIANEVFKSKPSSELISLIISLIILQSQSFIQQSPLTINKEMIDFLEKIFSEKSIIESIQFDFSNFFNSIFTIFVDNKIDDEFIYKIISLFVSIHKINDVKIKEPLRNIANRLNIKEGFYFSEEYIYHLISLMNLNNTIEILPILCINVINRGGIYFSILEKQIKYDIDYYIDDELLIYPVLLIFYFFDINKDLYHKSIKFNLSIFIHHLLNLFDVIYSLGILGFGSDNFDQIRHDVFCELFTLINEQGIYPQEMNTLISINIKDFIFLRLDNSQPLNTLFTINYDDKICTKNELETIVFSFKNFGKENSNNIQILSNLNLLFDKLHIYLEKNKLYINEQIKNCVFNLRIKANNWLDFDLVTQIFDFYKTKEVYQLNEFMNILASCTNKYDSTYIAQIKNKLSKSLYFKIDQQFDIKNYKKKLNSKLFIKSIKKILTSFISLNLQSMNKLNDIYQNYHHEFENEERKIENKKETTFNNAMNSLMINRSGWSKMKTKNHKTIYKRNNLLSCLYCCPLNVHKNFYKIINKKVKSNQINDKGLIKCKLNKIKSNKEAFIKINTNSIDLFYDTTKKVISFVDIYLTQYLIQKRKIQIIEKSGENFDLIFCRSDFNKLISTMSNNSLSFNNINKLLEELTSDWSEGKITNFEYLMKLNFFSGKSFNDASNYPIFPWILSRYDTSTLDLKSPTTFRDLSQPINGNDKPIEFYVYYWLLRIEPFNTKYKEKKLDYSSIFNSIDESYKSATTELIPEFFYLPEFLKSKEYGDVILPPWSNQSSIEFIYLHRKALESKFVSEHLNEWIDLIWGVKNNSNEESLYNLFKKEHPKRTHPIHNSSIQFSNENLIKYIKIKFKEISSFACGDVSLQSDKSLLHFSMIDLDGNIYFYSIKFDLFKNNEISVKSQKVIVKSEKSFLYQPMFIDPQRFCFIDKERKTVKIVNCISVSFEKPIEKSSEIISICAHQNGWIGISNEDLSVSIYHINHLSLIKQSFFQSSSNDNFYSSIEFYSYTGKVECIEINPIFNIFVCGTNDNCLLFCQLNLNKIKINRIVKIDGKPLKIIITDNFGFVVVLMQLKNSMDKQIKELAVYSINGEKIRSLSVDVESINKASSHNKFDYIILADKNNQIFVLETFYLKLKNPIYKCESKIKKLAYIVEESLIVAFCENGTASVIYYPIGY